MVSVTGTGETEIIHLESDGVNISTQVLSYPKPTLIASAETLPYFPDYEFPIAFKLVKIYRASQGSLTLNSWPCRIF